MKYKLTTNSKTVDGVTLYQIQALKSFKDVKKDDLGGWIEKESNLSQTGSAWVHNNAQVFGNARVFGDAWVFGNAWVFGTALVYDDARVYGNAWVSGNARVYDNARVSGNAQVYYNARVFGNAEVFDNAWVFSDNYAAPKETLLPEILTTLPKEVTAITIDGKNYKLKTETRWVVED